MTNVYKSYDVILLDDEYCIEYNFKDASFGEYERVNFIVNCPFCSTSIARCLYNEREIKDDENNIPALLEEHLRQKHSEQFLVIKNKKTIAKKNLIQFTLTKRIVL